MRRILFFLATFVLVVLLLELGSLLLLSVVEGRFVGPAVLREEREAIWSEEISRPEAGADDSATSNPAFERRLQELNVIHPFLGYVRNPEFSPDGYDAEALEWGFFSRGPIFYEPSEERVVVAVLGGSVARILAVQSDFLSRALAESPRFAGREVVVVSLAAGAYKQPQQIMALNYFLSLGAHFDVVLNVDGFNEVALPPAWNVPRGVFPYFPQNWDVRVGDLDLEERRRIGELVYLRARRRAWAKSMDELPWRASLTAGSVWKSLDGLWARRIGEAEKALRQSGPGDERDYQRHGPSRGYGSREAMFNDLAASWRRASIQLDALCRGLGIEYHHILQPNQYLPGAKPLSAEEREIAFEPDHQHRASVEEGYPHLLREGEELRRQGIAFHDLTQIFAYNGDTLYMDFCCHLNRRGNELFARKVARAVGGANPVTADP